MKWDRHFEKDYALVSSKIKEKFPKMFVCKWKTGLCVSFGQGLFHQGTLPLMTFLLSFVLIIGQIKGDQALTLTKVSEACSAVDVALGYLVTSSMSHGLTGVILVGLPLLGGFNYVPRFLHLWIMALAVLCRSLKASKKWVCNPFQSGFEYFLMFFNLFSSGHNRLLFELF